MTGLPKMYWFYGKMSKIHAVTDTGLHYLIKPEVLAGSIFMEYFCGSV